MVRSDQDLHAPFVDLTLSPERFGHREHLRLAWIALHEHADFAEAAGRFTRALRRYVTHVGAAAKYHETITWAYLALIREAMLGQDFADSESFLAAHPELLDHRGGALARRYDVAALTSDPVARRVFVLPTRTA
jgi:hypothetical protein